MRPPRDTCDKSRHLNVNSPVTHSSNTLIRVLAGINEQTGDISILIGKGRRFSLRKIREEIYLQDGCEFERISLVEKFLG